MALNCAEAWRPDWRNTRSKPLPGIKALSTDAPRSWALASAAAACVPSATQTLPVGSATGDTLEKSAKLITWISERATPWLDKPLIKAWAASR